MADKENEVTAGDSNASFIISVPSNIQALINKRTDENEKELNDQLKTADWLTNSLLEEAKQCFPTSEDIDHSNDGARDTVALERKLGMVFVTGRTFASVYQVSQFMKLIADKWGFSPRNDGTTIRCHFSERKVGQDIRYSKNMEETETQRKRTINCTNCPFSIKMSLGQKNRKRAFRQVTLTSVELKHNCKPSIVNHRVAIQSSGKMFLDPSKLHFVLHNIYQRSEKA